jgi:hypothetical protein
VTCDDYRGDDGDGDEMMPWRLQGEREREREIERERV